MFADRFARPDVGRRMLTTMNEGSDGEDVQPADTHTGVPQPPATTIIGLAPEEALFEAYQRGHCRPG